MTIFYIKMKIRAGGGSFRAGGGRFRAAGCSPLLFLFMGNVRRYMCSETLLIFLVCTFLFLIILMHFISFICAVFALSL